MRHLRNQGSCPIQGLGNKTRRAAAVVLKIMLDPTTPASTRLKAADIVFARAAQAIELEDLEARVSELERVARRRRSKAVDGRDAGSPFMGQLRQIEGQSSVIRPAPKAKSEHGIALTREPKEISERQKLCRE